MKNSVKYYLEERRKRSLLLPEEAERQVARLRERQCQKKTVFIDPGVGSFFNSFSHHLKEAESASLQENSSSLLITEPHIDNKQEFYVDLSEVSLSKRPLLNSLISQNSELVQECQVLREALSITKNQLAKIELQNKEIKKQYHGKEIKQKFIFCINEERETRLSIENEYLRFILKEFLPFAKEHSSMLASSYNKKSSETLKFFSIMNNSIHQIWDSTCTLESYLQ